MSALTNHTESASEAWDKRLMVHDWPECGPGALALEDLYQMFKARMAREAQSDDPKTLQK